MLSRPEPNEPLVRESSYGEGGLTAVDHFGVWLSGRAIRRAIGRRRDLDVVDLGCGYRASLLRSFRDRIAHGVGVDLRIADEARDDDRFEFIEATVESALRSFSSARFDVVLLTSVLEHLWNPEDTLREIRRVIRPGGMVLINVPTWQGKRFLEFSAFRLGTSPAREMDDHKMYYDRRDLWPMMVRAGFRPRDIRMSYHKFGLNLFAIGRASQA